MPRRGRPMKDLRLVAAVEHMAVMGFEESLVKSTVKELLKIYTEDGWLFIEENSYKVLLDTLLEKTASPPQEEEEEEEEEQEPALQPQLQQEEGGDGVAELDGGLSNNPPAIETEQESTKPGGAEEEEETEGVERKRKPYYGWISREESGDREIIELPPMPSNVFEEIWNSLPLVSDLQLDKTP